MRTNQHLSGLTHKRKAEGSLSLADAQALRNIIKRLPLHHFYEKILWFSYIPLNTVALRLNKDDLLYELDALCTRAVQSTFKVFCLFSAEHR